MNELKYCKFCDTVKLRNEFCKSGAAVKNMCRECQNKKQKQIYNDAKKTKQLQQENEQLKDNWNMLKEYIKTEIPEDVFVDTEWFVSILDIIQELEQGSDNK